MAVRTHAAVICATVSTPSAGVGGGAGVAGGSGAPQFLASHRACFLLLFFVSLQGPQPRFFHHPWTPCAAARLALFSACSSATLCQYGRKSSSSTT